jgi:hypothetical protein
LHDFVTHLTPRESQLIPRQLAVALKARRPQMRRDSQVVEF